MKIAVIGGGVSGLTAAYQLIKFGHDVSVFERDSVLGGLAHGFKGKDWDWPLEFAYHHFFTNDYSIINLARELGMNADIIIKRPITATLLPLDQFSAARDENYRSSLPERQVNKIYQLDSPVSLLKFNRLSITDRLRTGAMLAFCKANPFWKPLESTTAKQFIRNVGGEAGWNTIWEPLLTGKFAGFADRVCASWFWARIKKRTSNLGYFRGGFQNFVETLSNVIRQQGGMILTRSAIDRLIFTKNGKYKVALSNNTHSNDTSIHLYDNIILTTPTPIAVKLLNPLLTKSSQLTTHNYPPLTIPHLHAQTLILETDMPILKDVYWLNINDRSFPFLAAVAHTNFIDKTHYNNHHLTYFGNYLPNNHSYLTMTKEALLKKFMPFIKKIASIHHSPLTIHHSYLFTAPFAQPVHEVHYSTKAPHLVTPAKGVYLANMDSIFPWDRGTNYAVELGTKVAHVINYL